MSAGASSQGLPAGESKKRKSEKGDREEAAKKAKTPWDDLHLTNPAGVNSKVYKAFKYSQAKSQLYCLPCLEESDGKKRNHFPLNKSSTGNLWTHLRTHHSRLHSELKDEKKSKADGLAALGVKVLPKVSDQEKITWQIAKWIALSLRPLHLVTDAEFRVLLTMLNPMYELPKTSKPFKTRIVDLSSGLRKHIRGLFEDVDACSLTVDGWTSNSNAHFLAVTAHAIDADWNAHTFTLAVRELQDRSFARVLAQVIKQVALDFGISQKVVSITTDGAADIGKAIELLQGKGGLDSESVQHVLCACHRLNLVLGDAIKSSKFDKLLSGRGSKRAEKAAPPTESTSSSRSCTV
jgi:hypothetical protein